MKNAKTSISSEKIWIAAASIGVGQALALPLVQTVDTTASGFIGAVVVRHMRYGFPCHLGWRLTMMNALISIRDWRLVSLKKGNRAVQSALAGSFR